VAGAPASVPITSIIVHLVATAAAKSAVRF
jgi:hypothetical protein